jgi:hypothetical protein
MPRGNPEAVLQSTIVAGLRLGLPHGFEVWHIPNGGKRSPREGALFKKMGVTAGAPDIIILGQIDGEPRVWFFEVKAGTMKRPTDVQMILHDRLRDLGFEVAVVRSWTEALRVCNLWKLPLRFAREYLTEASDGNT